MTANLSEIAFAWVSARASVAVAGDGKVDG